MLLAVGATMFKPHEQLFLQRGLIQAFVAEQYDGPFFGPPELHAFDGSALSQGYQAGPARAQAQRLCDWGLKRT